MGRKHCPHARKCSADMPSPAVQQASSDFALVPLSVHYLHVSVAVADNTRLFIVGPLSSQYAGHSCE